MSQKLTEEVVTAYICAIDYVVSKSVGKWLPVENPNIMDEDELEQPSEPCMSIQVYRASKSALFKLRKGSAPLHPVGQYIAYRMILIPEQATDSPEHGLVLECENNNQAIHAVIFYRYAKDILHEFEKRTASLDMKTAAIELSLTFICDNQIIERDPSLWAEFLCISSQDNQGLKDLERTVVFKILLASPYIHLRTSHMCIQVAGLFFTTSSMLEKTVFHRPVGKGKIDSGQEAHDDRGWKGTHVRSNVEIEVLEDDITAMACGDTQVPTNGYPKLVDGLAITLRENHSQPAHRAESRE
ncbi:hypothetical protein DFJ43DRAFT_1159430 [Lentinula guzmanii]|uniref:Uncharacterized protein n=1 Tax=Lentinula guzmanii TaxID=2804957 RepID=A0AA38MVW7_9AGAR|nr:hypothetical protein DFJ43DRAFT_1159430 [Lentinula guzmanii]